MQWVVDKTEPYQLMSTEAIVSPDEDIVVDPLS